VRKRISALLVLPVVIAFIASCGGSNHHTTTPQEVPVVVSISDQASSTGVLSFDLQITAACLLTSAQAADTDCTGAQNLITAPVTVQLENLQTPQESDVLASTQVQAGTYTAILLTFGTSTVAINVDPGTTDTDSTDSCTAAATPTVCELTPVVNPTSVTLPFGTAAVLTSGQPANIGIDFNVASSLAEVTAGTTNTITIDPTLNTVTFNTFAGTDGNLLDVSQVTGTVSNVSSTGFDVTDSATGQLLPINSSATTTFNGFTSCTTSNLACVVNNQNVTVNFGVSGTTSLVNTATSVSDNAGIAFGQGFEGTVIETGANPMILVTSVPAGNTQGVTVGQTLSLVPPATSAGFSVATPAGQTLPAGVSFAGAGDLVDGQNVLIDSTGVATAGGVSTTTADQIILEPTQFTGTLSSINNPNVTIGGLNSFFTDNNVQNINFQTGTQTTFGGDAESTGFSGLTVGDLANLNGFLFNGGVGQPPVVFGENIVDNGSAATEVKKAK
jgi:hypothetical protein